MKATSRTGYGSGWHKQSIRHSNARKTGRAGGHYSYGGDYKKVTPHHYMDLTYNQLAKKGVKLDPSKDSDKDGVPNSLDCRPLNKNAQDDGLPANVTMETSEPKKSEKQGFLSRLQQELAERKEKKRVEEEKKTKEEIEKLNLDIEKERLEREKIIQHEKLKKDLADKKKELESLKDPNREERIKKRQELLKKIGGIAKREIKLALSPYNPRKSRHKKVLGKSHKKKTRKKDDFSLFG